MTTRELVERQVAARRLAFVVYLYATGRLNDFALHDEDGDRVPDPDVCTRVVARPPSWRRIQGALDAARGRSP